MKTLTVLYDDACPICVRARAFLETQASFVRLEFLSCHSPLARKRYGAVPWLGQELVVVSDEGDVWAGPSAFIVCLWALFDYREWAYTLSGDAFAPLAERFFKLISKRRKLLAVFLPHSTCPGGACRSGAHVKGAYR